MIYHGINLKKTDIKKINDILTMFTAKPSFENHCAGKSKIKLSTAETNVIFVAFDRLLTTEKLKEIFNEYRGCAINVILKVKDYDALLVAYHNHATYIFDSGLTEKNIESALINSSLLDNHKGVRIPVEKIMKLFLAPVKVKNNNDLYEHVKKYFSRLRGIKQFAIVSFSEEETDICGKVNYNEIHLERIQKIKVPNKYIGHEHTLVSGDVCELALPVYIEGDQQAFLYLKVEESEKNFILNSLFYKYLENVLIYRKNKKKEHALQKLARTDDVTGLYNQRKLAEDLEREVAAHEAEHEKFSIMFLDVDHFKLVNDNHGHLVGSSLLTQIGTLLREQLRSSDHVYRYGGDEFIVVMPNVEISVVHQIAVRICDKVKATEFPIGNDETYSLSLSIGIAEYPTDASSAMEIIKFADDMMYQSKQTGRGKVVHIKEIKESNATTSSE